MAKGCLKLAAVISSLLLALLFLHTYTLNYGRTASFFRQQAILIPELARPQSDKTLSGHSEDPTRTQKPHSQVVASGSSTGQFKGAVLRIYEQYHDKEAWPFLRTEEKLFQGLCQSPGQVRINSSDVDGPALLSILQDNYYQNVMCEYGGYFALAANLDTVHTEPWIGFQSWRAESKGFSLKSLAVEKLIHSITDGNNDETLFFWANHGNGNSLEVDSLFYDSCDRYHRSNCSFVFEATFSCLYNYSKENSLPPMPEDGNGWAYMSYWAMPTMRFASYISYARMFLVVLDGLFYGLHHDRQTCPLAGICRYCPPGTPPDYLTRHCWCFLLERLVNIWAYHTGLRMVYLNPETGEMVEQHPIQNRTIWTDWFGRAALESLTSTFPVKAASLPRGLQLYQHLGQKAQSGS